MCAEQTGARMTKWVRNMHACWYTRHLMIHRCIAGSVKRGHVCTSEFKWLRQPDVCEAVVCNSVDGKHRCQRPCHVTVRESRNVHFLYRETPARRPIRLSEDAGGLMPPGPNRLTARSLWVRHVAGTLTLWVQQSAQTSATKRGETITKADAQHV